MTESTPKAATSGNGAAGTGNGNAGLSAENRAVLTQLTRKDFVSDQEVRWCPGCGD